MSIAAVLGSRNVISLLLRGGGGNDFLPAEFGFRGAVEKHINKMNKEKCNKNKTEMKNFFATSPG